MITQVNSLRLLAERRGERFYQLNLKKEGVKYKAGQYFTLAQPNSEHKFYYSAFSHPKEKDLVFYIRSRSDSYTQKFLDSLSVASAVELEGGFGYESLTGSNRHSFFISQGCCISPVRSLYLNTTSNLIKTCLHIDSSTELLALEELAYTPLLKRLKYTSEEDLDCLYDHLDFLLTSDLSPKDIYYCVEKELEDHLLHYLEQKYMYSKLINLRGK